MYRRYRGTAQASKRERHVCSSRNMTQTTPTKARGIAPQYNDKRDRQPIAGHLVKWSMPIRARDRYGPGHKGTALDRFALTTEREALGNQLARKR